MERIDQYKHLNKEHEIGLNVGIEDVAKFIVDQNYGACRLMSAMISALREKAEVISGENYSPIGDRLEAILDDGLFY